MVTTTRRSYEVANAYGSANAGVELLERPRTYEEYNYAPMAAYDLEEAKERRRNLDKLLNYDRYSQEVENVQTETVENSAPVADPVAFSDEDIRPTSTTMQFGDDIDSIREEMNMAKEEEQTKYRLNNKGKLVVVLYSLVVTVILALIILNTGLLANLSNVKAAKAAELDAVMERYQTLNDEIADISSSEHIAEVAENNLKMIKGE